MGSSKFIRGFGTLALNWLTFQAGLTPSVPRRFFAITMTVGGGEWEQVFFLLFFCLKE